MRYLGGGLNMVNFQTIRFVIKEKLVELISTKKFAVREENLLEKINDIGLKDVVAVRLSINSPLIIEDVALLTTENLMDFSKEVDSAISQNVKG